MQGKEEIELTLILILKTLCHNSPHGNGTVSNTTTIQPQVNRPDNRLLYCELQWCSQRKVD